MPIQIYGSGSDVSIATYHDGAEGLFGAGRSKVISSFMSYEAQRRIELAEASFCITTDRADHLVDPNNKGLLERTKTNPSMPMGAIHYYEGDAEGLKITLVVSDATFLSMKKQFEILLCSTDGYFDLSVHGFSSFRIPEAETECPTLPEFYGGKPYFVSDFELLIGKKSPQRA